MSRQLMARSECRDCVHVVDIQEDEQGRDVITCDRDTCGGCVPVAWAHIIRYALKHTKGVVKTSTITRHVYEDMDAQEAKAVLDSMTAAGYLTEPERVGQVYVRHVTDKGREAVE